eukprot:TRINITY_DN18425_c0_g1_i1.p1 TRINITY_DN18425_c0_g1~~TRINITY_DN18425_c0_g1_i1.p1  ORF type:complete len:513 (+),score=86.81 TRINITY_DN18425_c0_g1_i1:28-1539(+)
MASEAEKGTPVLSSTKPGVTMEGKEDELTQRAHEVFQKVGKVARKNNNKMTKDDILKTLEKDHILGNALLKNLNEDENGTIGVLEWLSWVEEIQSSGGDPLFKLQWLESRVRPFIPSTPEGALITKESTQSVKKDPVPAKTENSIPPSPGQTSIKNAPPTSSAPPPVNKVSNSSDEETETDDDESESPSASPEVVKKTSVPPSPVPSVVKVVKKNSAPPTPVKKSLQQPVKRDSTQSSSSKPLPAKRVSSATLMLKTPPESPKDKQEESTPKGVLLEELEKLRNETERLKKQASVVPSSAPVDVSTTCGSVGGLVAHSPDEEFSVIEELLRGVPVKLAEVAWRASTQSNTGRIKRLVVVTDRALYSWTPRGKMQRCISIRDVSEIFTYRSWVGIKVPSEFDLQLEFDPEASFESVFKSLSNVRVTPVGGLSELSAKLSTVRPPGWVLNPSEIVPLNPKGYPSDPRSPASPPKLVDVGRLLWMPSSNTPMPLIPGLERLEMPSE